MAKPLSSAASAKVKPEIEARNSLRLLSYELRYALSYAFRYALRYYRSLNRFLFEDEWKDIREDIC